MAAREDTPAVFQEKQRFRQPWIWALLLGIAGLSIYSFVQQIFLGEPFGSNPAPDYMVAIIAVFFGLGFPIVFSQINLTTEVRPEGVYYRFFPFQLSFRKISPEDIASYEAREYSPVKEYGGWGIRFGPSGKAYNISGSRGVQFRFVDGKQLLIGSRRADEMAAAMSRAFGK